MATSGTIDEVQALLRAGRLADASRRLLAAAAADEPEAAATLAHWRIAGNVIRRDLPEARRLLGLAAAQGDTDSAVLYASFLASGVGGPDDWPDALELLRGLAREDLRARTQLERIEAMDIDPLGFPSRPPELRSICEAPEVYVSEAFMTKAECTYLREAGEPTLQRSVVVDPATGVMVPHPVRTSDVAIFGVFGEDLVINALNRRLAALSETRPEQGEPLQLLRYGPGGEYKPHMDALPNEANQRILTILVYLSDDYAGGETSFPRTGLSFRGKIGDALLFRNTSADGRPDPLALHAGLPVTRGVKYLASRWVRAARFSYPPPQPLLNI